MSKSFSSQCLQQHRAYPARITKVQTAHGIFTTPSFMPVATKAAMNTLSVSDLRKTGTQIILGGNTYHMLVSPGLSILEKQGGMHRFMNWQGPMLTDSGGYQVFSLSKNKKLCRIDDNGAHFKHPLTHQTIHMTPTVSLQAQKVIGADIIMAFDQCTPEEGGREAALSAMEKTHRWLLESIDYHHKTPCSVYGYEQALFGIIQGGAFRDLREKSMEFILSLDLDGIAIGGESIGFNMPLTREILSWLVPTLPQHKLRYTMGVGLNPQDLIDVVQAGADIFDCVAPTRNARHGALYHGFALPDGDWLRFQAKDGQARLLIKQQKYANDETAILTGCDCYTCQHYSRAYMHYLFKQKLPLYLSLACAHNIRVMQQTCEMLQKVIFEHAIEN